MDQGRQKDEKGKTGSSFTANLITEMCFLNNKCTGTDFLPPVLSSDTFTKAWFY